MRTIIAVFAIVLAGAIFFVYTKPTYDSIQATQVQIAQYNAALNKATQLQALKQSLLSRYNSFNPDDLARLQTMLPDQVNNIGLILDLDTLANQYGLSLENVGIDSLAAGSSGQSGGAAAPTSLGTSASPYESLDVTFTLHCTYSEFIQYVTSLETSLRVVDLIVLSVSSGGTQNGPAIQSATLASSTAPGADNNVYTFGVTLRTYWLK